MAPVRPASRRTSESSAGRIDRVGKLAGSSAATEIDATGLVAAPGFIDAHTHDDRLMLSAPDMAPKVSQGVTTVIAGNCGVSLAPAPRGMREPVTPPLDLWTTRALVPLPTFATTSRRCEQPAATNCAFAGGAFDVARADDGAPRSSCQCVGARRDAAPRR
jgi:N-acyl-D-amino-acid deacylase